MSLQINLIKTPYIISFSKNQVLFVFGCTPYGAVERSQDIRLSIRVQIEETFNSNLFTDIYAETFVPDNEGLIKPEISTVLDAYLTYYTPPVNINIAQQATGQRKRYRLLYLLQKDGQPVGTTITSNTFFVLKGAVSDEVLSPALFIQQQIIAAQKPLFYGVPTEKVGMDEWRFLFWLYPYNDAATQTITLTVYLNNNTTATKTYTITNTANWAVCLCPIGFNQTQLNNLVGAGLAAEKYSIQVTTNTATIIAELFFKIDHRHFYETYQLFYRNSLGGTDTIRLTGKVDFEAEYEKQQAKVTNAPGSFSNLLLNATTIENHAEEQPKFKGDTGFITKPQLEKLRDLMLSRQVFQYKEGNLVPVYLNAKNVKFFGTKDSLFSMQIEWSLAINSYAYTPANIVTQPNACPGMELLTVTQKNRDQLQIMYSLPLPYDKVQFEVYNGTTTDVFMVTGNHGSFLKNFTNPATTTPVAITVKGRVICNEYSTPITAGAFTTVNLNVNGNSLPVANDDAYSINSGYNTAISLNGSVLANDYDPDGDILEVVAAAGATTQSGSYTINAAGNITYTPPSSSFAGLDSFVYQVREIGSATTIQATVRITVGSAIVGVFAALSTKNITTIDFGQAGGQTDGEIWAEFFSDPALTQRLDITSYNLTVNYRKTEFQQDHNNPSSPTTNNTDLTFNPVGNSFKVYEGLLVYNYQDTQWNAADIIRNEFLLLTGTGYTPI